LDPGDIAMMVGAPDIDDMIEPATELFEMVGDVAGEIGVLPVFALHDTVFLITENARPEPPCTVLKVNMAARLQLAHRTFDLTGVVKRAFRKPLVESDPELLEIFSA